MSDEPEMPDDPVALVEDYIIEQGWSSERTSDHELWSEIPGQWGSQRLWVAYHEESGFLQFNCYLNVRLPERFFNPVAEAITLINERIWIGHFEIWTEELTPVFRIVVPLRGSALCDEQVDDVIGSMYQECERFFPVFQWIVWGGKTPEEAVAAAIVDTEGEA